MSQQILHADFIRFKLASAADERQALMAEAGRLAPEAGALSVIAIEAATQSDFDLVLLFVLPDFAALEPFGTNAAYIRFLQGRVAPVLQQFAGADVRLDSDFQPVEGSAACLALAAPAETYDWEVRERLGAWASGASAANRGHVQTGLAIGEKQRYRGLVIVAGDTRLPLLPAIPGFETALISGRARSLA